MLDKARNILFYMLVLCLPINLGKHVISSTSYVKYHLVDYLVPTLWFVDILVFANVAFWLLTGGINKVWSKPYFRLVMVFLFSLLPSVAFAQSTTPALYAYFSMMLHVFLALAISTSITISFSKEKLLKILGVSVFFISFLAVLQWFNQGAIFNNYLFFGEQPYDAFSDDIYFVNFFGEKRIPPYSLFRHPNVLGGYLSIALLWVFYGVRYLKDNLFLKASLLLGVLVLGLTFSVTAQITFVLGGLFLFFIKKYGKVGVKISIFLTTLVFLLGLFLPLLSKVGWFQEHSSIYRRSNLEKSALMMIERQPLFGIGLNNFTLEQENFLPSSQILRFIQPVHNVFLLLFAESGIFSFISFLAILVYCQKTLLEQHFGFAAVLFISVLQFFILGSFDHYLYTIHQMQILFWLTVGLSLTYTSVDVEV